MEGASYASTLLNNIDTHENSESDRTSQLQPATYLDICVYGNTRSSTELSFLGKTDFDVVMSKDKTQTALRCKSSQDIKKPTFQEIDSLTSRIADSVSSVHLRTSQNGEGLSSATFHTWNPEVIVRIQDCSCVSSDSHPRLMNSVNTVLLWDMISNFSLPHAYKSQLR